MSNLRLWSIIIPIALTVLKHNESKNLNSIENYRDVNLIGGFVGCRLQNVCLDEEVCVDSPLFGKCVGRNEITDQILESTGSINVGDDAMKSIPPEVRNLDWSDIYVQCLVRSLALALRRGEYNFDPEAFCNGSDEKSYNSEDSNKDSSELDDENRLPNLVLPVLQDNNQKTVKRRWPYQDVDSDWSMDDNPRDWDQESHSKSSLEDFDQKIKLLIKLARRYAKSVNLPDETDQSETNDGQSKQTNPLHSTIRIKASKVKDEKKSAPNAVLSSSVRKNMPFGSVIKPDPVDETPMRRTSRKAYRQMSPMNRQLDLRWVWVKFAEPNLKLDTRSFIQWLSKKLHLPSRIPKYYLDMKRQVLYFYIPSESGSTGEEVVDALNQDKEIFQLYGIESVGLGRWGPIETFPTKSDSQTSEAWFKNQNSDPDDIELPPNAKHHTITLIICLLVFGFTLVILGFCALKKYTNRLRFNHDEHQTGERTSKTQLLGFEQLDQGNLGRKPSFPYRIRQFFQSSAKQDPIMQTQGVDQIITQPIRPQIERQRGQPSLSSFDKMRRDTLHEDSISSDDSLNQKKRKSKSQENSFSQRSSVSSWSSDPVQCSIDVATGHLILSYMEEHLKDSQRLESDWAAVQVYEAEEAVPCEDALKEENQSKNRQGVPMPFEQSRVRLRNSENDYINASLLYDHSPRNPVYIATPTTMATSIADFWMMIWEQSSVVIVCLERSDELVCLDDVNEENRQASVKYWPNEGTQVYGSFEVHLVSEHSWCENYIVRSLYLKNLTTWETRTVTQFHYLTWKDAELKSDTNIMLEFRRKVNRSFRGMMSPIVVHCRDGCGRTGTYILLDLVLSRIAKGVKEIDIAASLEHLRDQRPKMIESKEQYEFVLSAIAQEVDAMLKTNA